MTSKSGFFLIARGLMEHARFKPKGPFSDFEAWIWLIEHAAYSRQTVPILNGTNRTTIVLEPGQLSHSIRYLAEAWRWSDKRVQRFLATTQSDHSVTTQTTTGQTVITLCNWGKYQRPYGDSTTQTTTATTTQTTTNKKEGKEKKEYARFESGFSEWYSAYGKKVHPKEAAKAYARVIASGDISESRLLDQTKAFAAKWSSEPKERRKFMPYPASWLNKGGYASEQDDGTAKPAETVNPLAFDDGQWRKRLAYSIEASLWLEAWGPKPGLPGCLVPAHLLISPVSKTQGAA